MTTYNVTAVAYGADESKNVIIGTHEADTFGVDGGVLTISKKISDSGNYSVTVRYEQVACYAQGMWTSIQKVEQRTTDADPA